MANVAQVLIEVGRLHMENVELRAINEEIGGRLKELEAIIEGRRTEVTDVPPQVIPRPRKPRTTKAVAE